MSNVSHHLLGYRHVCCILVIGIGLSVGVGWSQITPDQPYISEFMAKNDTSDASSATILLDEDGDASDWIEIANPTPRPCHQRDRL